MCRDQKFHFSRVELEILIRHSSREDEYGVVIWSEVWRKGLVSRSKYENH